MQTTMSSRPPPLPVRQRSHTSVTHTTYKQGQKSEPVHQTDPCHTSSNNVTHVRIGHIHGNRRRMTEPTLPMIPQRPDSGNHPIRKRSIETNSFIDRNTARIFSDPDHVSQSPPPPPRIHHRSQHSTTPDFESRFRFHGPSDFPEPELVTKICTKAYPSTSVRRKHTQAAEVTLDPL